MEEFFADPVTFISLFVTVDLIVLLLIFYFVRERREEREIEKMQSQIHATVPTSPEAPQREVLPKMSAPIRTVIGKSKILTNVPGKITQMKVTAGMIDMIRTMDTGSWFTKTIIKKFIPEDQLNELMDKALKGELEEGMVITIRDGKITIEKDDPAVL